MKRAETIITEINKLEKELYKNYTPKEIKRAIEKCEETKKTHSNNCDLISVLYEGAINELDNELLYKEVK